MSKPVYKYSKEGKFICKYQSTTQAANDLGADESTIRRAADNQRMSCGFSWSRYRIDENNIPETKVIDKPAGPRIMILDIETSPCLAYVWATNMWKVRINPDQLESQWFILTYSYKWLGEDRVISNKLTGEEALAEDDGRIVMELWNAIDSADIIVAHNGCVEKNTPILMQDLTWKPAGELKIGDKIVGFEEKTKPGETRRNNIGKWNGRGERKITPAEVTNIEIDSRPTLEVEFDNGDKVIVTHDHYWLGMSENCRNQQWYRTDKLRIGQRVNKFISPWQEDKSYESGWLSGFISGEGTLKANGASIDFCQRPTVVLDQAIKYCEKLNIKIAPPCTKIGGLGRGDTLYTYTVGGKWKTLETLGKLKISRLINNINWNKFGGINSNAQNDTTRTIVGIKESGVQEIAVIETTSGTYIADGYPMHNCKFDVPNIQTRFLIHGLPPTSSFKQIDTLKVAQQQFGFTHNNLDALAKLFDIPGKIHTGFELWKRCLFGEDDALKEMETYNRHDVEMLELIYLKLRPYIKGHPNYNLYAGSDKPLCSHCGSTHVVPNGYYYFTQTCKYINYRCMDCGALSRGRKSILDKKKDIIISNG